MPSFVSCSRHLIVSFVCLDVSHFHYAITRSKVGADGVGSAVRRELERADTGVVSEVVYAPTSTYKWVCVTAQCAIVCSMQVAALAHERDFGWLRCSTARGRSPDIR